MKLKEPEKLWNRYFVLICVVSLIMRSVNQIHSTTMPLFAIAQGANNASAGLLNSIMSITALFSRPVMGGLVDSQGRRRLLITGTAMQIFCLTCYMLFGAKLSFVVMLCLQVVFGLGFSATSVAMTTINTDTVPQNRMLDGIAYFGLASTLSMAIGPNLAISMSEGLGYNKSFGINAIIAVVAIVFSFMISYERRWAVCDETPEVLKTVPADKSSWLNKLAERSALLGSGIMLVFSFASSSLTTFLATYALQSAIANVGWTFTAKAIGQGVSRVIVAKITRSIGSTYTLLLGGSVYALGFILIFFTTNWMLFAIAGFCMGVGYGLTQTVLNTAVVLHTPKERRGAANATFYMGMDIGIGCGGIVWGAISDITGLRSIYFFAAVVCIAATGASLVKKQYFDEQDRMMSV